MEFEKKKRVSGNEEKYKIENLKIAREFSKKLLEEMGETVRSIVIFGSTSKSEQQKETSDIDIMVVLDNVSVFVTDELREAYRIISQNLIQNISNNRIHLMTLNLSDLWDMSRKSDPILVNILRHGVPLFDRDLVEPLQYLLEIGKIRPSKETVYNYLARSETLLSENQKYMEMAVSDLYYSVVDSVHSSLMVKGVQPPSPKEMPSLFKKTFKSNKELNKFSKEVDFFYKLYKDVENKKVGYISGEFYDQVVERASTLVQTLNKFTREEVEKTAPEDIESKKSKK